MKAASEGRERFLELGYPRRRFFGKNGAGDGLSAAI